ncbi:MAG: YCF48-related protein [Bacteroidales bacterium]|nr:YCF48-related protein [Bacteroidales bacterium]
MKKSILFILVSVAVISCQKENNFNAKWEVINLSYTGDLSDIFLLPPDTIMILSKLDDSFDKTCIFESDDEGRTWTQRCFDKQTTGGFSDFYCFNHFKIISGDFKSNDGGYNWYKLGALLGAPTFFFNDHEGIGAIGSSLYRTNDGCNSVEMVFDSSTYAGIHFIQFLNNSTGYAAGGASFDSFNSGLIVKTTDGGNTWQPLPDKFKSIIGISFISENIGYIIINLYEGSVVGTYKSGAELLKTIDGGSTWTSINSKIYDEFKIIPFKCYFADEQHGFLFGTGNGSKILSTIDGGKTWKEEYTNNDSDYTLNKILFATSTTGFAIGNNGLLLKRIINDP